MLDLLSGYNISSRWRLLSTVVKDTLLRKKISMSIENKVVIVTGASSGIGEAIARELAHSGCSRNVGSTSRRTT